MQSRLHGDAYPDVETAVAAAKEKANKNDFILLEEAALSLRIY